MHLEQIKAFVAVVEARSISRAARALHLSQPALSVRLKALENYVGCPLLTRSYDGVSPTAAGEVVFETGRRVVDLCDDMIRSVRSPSAQPILSIGATPTLGGYVLPHALGPFVNLNPNVQVNLTVTHVSGVVQQVADGHLLMGFVEGPLSVPGLVSQDLGPDELRLVASTAWNDLDPLDATRAFALPHVLCIPECGMRQVLERYLQSHGLSVARLPAVAELDNLDAVKALVEGGAGVAWISPRAVQREVQAGTLRVVNVAGVQIPFTYIVLYRKDRGLSTVSRRFISLVRERLRPHRRQARPPAPVA